nr:aldehyde dehydrogenase family protein [Mesorhizobium intechi]
MVARKISPVLAAGCAVILKPAEQTPPVVAGAMIAFAAEAGFPEGVVNRSMLAKAMPSAAAD